MPTASVAFLHLRLLTEGHAAAPRLATQVPGTHEDLTGAVAAMNAEHRVRVRKGDHRWEGVCPRRSAETVASLLGQRQLGSTVSPPPMSAPAGWLKPTPSKSLKMEVVADKGARLLGMWVLPASEDILKSVTTPCAHPSAPSCTVRLTRMQIWCSLWARIRGRQHQLCGVVYRRGLRVRKDRRQS